MINLVRRKDGFNLLLFTKVDIVLLYHVLTGEQSKWGYRIEEENGIGCDILPTATACFKVVQTHRLGAVASKMRME